MTPEQKELVRTSFDKVVPISDVAAKLFYTRLFELDPSLKSLFLGDMEEQGRKLMTMIKVAVSSLDRLDHLVPAVQALGERHGKYGVPESSYATVGEALIWTLGQGLGPDFTPEVETAWVETYTILSGVMKEASYKAV